MTGRLRDKVAIITGAASGIGAATARRFSAEGARVIVADLQTEKGLALAREIGRADFLRTDVTREADIEAVVRTAQERYGRLDCMINNAGVVGAVGSVRDIAAEDFLSTLSVLLCSVFYGMKHAARIMVEQREGCILSTASIAGVAAFGPHPYASAKHGVVGLTRSVASELAPFGIRVNAIAPGTVPTLLTEAVYGSVETARRASAERTPLGRPIEPEDIAAGFLYLASDDGRSQTGQVLVIDGGTTACPSAARFHSDDARFIGLQEAQSAR